MNLSHWTLAASASPIVVVAALALAQEPSRLAGQDARLLIEAGRYEQAAELARREHDALRQIHGDDAPVVGSAADLLVRALILDGRASDGTTRALAERTLRIKEAHYGAQGAELVTSLLNLSDVLIVAAEFEQAIGFAQRAVTIAEQTQGRDDRVVADALDHLGEALGGGSRYDEAARTLEQSLRLREQAEDGARLALARTLEHLALVLQRKGEYERAGAAARRAAAIQQATTTDHPAYATTLNLVAQQLWFEGRLLESKASSEDAVALAERTLRPDHPTVALSLRYLANTLGDLGDSTRSRDLTERALEIAIRTFGPDHHVTAKYIHSLGLSELDQGDYPAARRHFQQALTIYQTQYGPWNELVATALSVLALADARLGDYARANRDQARAVAVYTRIGGATHPYVAVSLTELATIYLEQGMPGRALPLLERALVIREKVLEPDHRDIARTLVDLASTLMRLGQPTRAQRLAVRALGIWEGLDVPDAPDYATVLALYAELQARRGDHAVARDYFSRAMAIRARVFGESNPLFADAQAGLALSLASLGDGEAALSTAVQAETTGRDHLRLMLRSLPERQALNYTSSRPKGLPVLLSLSVLLPDAAPAAFDAVIRSRALVLDEIAARQAAGESDPARMALASAQQRLANLMVRGPGSLSNQRYAALIEGARSDSERAEQVLAESSAAFRSERSRSQVSLADVTGSLPSDDVLVAFARYDRMVPARQPSANAMRSSRIAPEYLAFVLRRDQAPVAVTLGDAGSIEELVSRWRTDIAAEATMGEPASTGEAPRSSRESGAVLRRAIWDPVAGRVGKAARIFIVPDGALGLVPFAALPIGRRSFVVESSPVIHYLSAERDLTLGPQGSTASRGLLALGGAAFDGTAGTRAPGTRATSTRAPPAARGVSQPCADLQSLRFEPLTGTSREVREVSALWQANQSQMAVPGNARVLVGSAADETTFKTDAPRHRVLHLATHGFFLGTACAPSPSGARGVGGLARAAGDTVQNPLLLSGLALAGANRRAQAKPDEDDGILTAEEVATLNLQGVEWAVLSACDTGVGEIKAGEGVFGLRRAFQVAGARTVIMSLWSVEDQATRAWMRALYEGRFQRNLSTADAVHQASLTVLRDRRAKGLSTHPFFWAAFVAAGDWR